MFFIKNEGFVYKCLIMRCLFLLRHHYFFYKKYIPLTFIILLPLVNT
ncbi:hypothetical protein M23134_06112 [Microscilla marina ATCC 23134]|uniref:Uncharacterized protein n=1 Tax=Microscilla marina ATCC 23134 TaxID=313606 RepID=A1ZSK5_MICM2|nr:hypothetical protein M23134_06112 [Microscilla marina ATCC 23134]